MCIRDRIDSIFSPIRRCSYKVEKTRVEDNTDYDSLVLDVESNSLIIVVDIIVLLDKISL